MNYQLELISHQIENAHIHQRRTDGYVNATAMCKVAGKLFGHYRTVAATREFLEELSGSIGIPIDHLIITVSTGSNNQRGTWVHPDVAVHLAQWCSPKFAVAVARWVREWMEGKAKGAPALPYHLRRYVANASNVPAGHFSILNEMIMALIAPMETRGYTLPEGMIPDISEGKMFCRWLREQMNIDTNKLPKYKHVWEDGRVVSANAYPESLLADFRRHFREEWLPKRAQQYFEEKDPRALPFLIPLLEDQKKEQPKASPPVPRKLGAQRMREIINKLGPQPHLPDRMP